MSVSTCGGLIHGGPYIRGGGLIVGGLRYKTSSIELLFLTSRQNGKDPSLFCNKICCQTSMFINSHMGTIGNIVMFRYIPGKCRDIPCYSATFRDIPPYSVIFRHSGFSQRPLSIV